MPCGFGHDLADPRRVGAERVRAHRRECGVGLVGGDDGDDLALVGDVERIDPQQVARADHGGCDRQRRLVEHDGQVGVARQLVAHGADPAPRRVAHPARRRAPLRGARRRGRRAARCRSGCRPRGRGRLGPASPPCRGRPIVPETSTTSPARTGSGPRSRPAGITPTPAVVMYTPSAAPSPDHLRVAGDDRDAGRRPRPRPCRRRSARSSATGKPSSMTKAADSHVGGRPARRGR